MLKPTDPPAQPGSGSERPVGELVHQLVENGKAYAQSELGLVKAIASDKARALTVPGILFGTAFVLLQAGFSALAVATFLAILPLVGPFLAGVLAFLIFAGLAGALGWLGVKKLGKDQ
jgi:hypothetical protein